MEYLTIPQAAKRIHKSKNTVYALVNEGRIPYYNNGCKLIREDHLDRFMEENYLISKKTKKVVEFHDTKGE